MDTPALVCFDLDDTLIREIHSVMLLCILNGRLEPLLEIEKREHGGEIDWISADHLKARLTQGLQTSMLERDFLRIAKPLEGIADTAMRLHTRGIRSIIVTAGPRQVAHTAARVWGLDGGFGSDYEVKCGSFTGKISRHVGDSGKIGLLSAYCQAHDISPAACVAVGDGQTDLPIFAYCGRSIAINYKPDMIGQADHYIKTNDLRDILPILLDENEPSPI